MNKILSIILLSSILVFSMIALTAADPNGANNVTAGTTGRPGVTSPQNHTAIAGNVTELTITGNGITQSWQGYYGNVSGAIRLANNAGNVMYNWSLASPQGEIYSSNASSITWANIACFNWTANGTGLEAAFGIDSNDADGVNETFATGNNHDQFYVGTANIAGNSCMSTRVFDDTGAGVDNYFEEVLLSDTANTVFASILEQNEAGFDGGSHDFEMLVLENGHMGDSATTTYFFYVELE